MEKYVYLALWWWSSYFAAVMSDSVPVLIWSNDRCCMPHTFSGWNVWEDTGRYKPRIGRTGHIVNKKLSYRREIALQGAL